MQFGKDAIFSGRFSPMEEIILVGWEWDGGVVGVFRLQNVKKFVSLGLHMQQDN